MNRNSVIFLVVLSLFVISGGWYLGNRVNSLHSMVMSIENCSEQPIGDKNKIIQTTLNYARDFEKQKSFDMASMFYINGLNHLPGEITLIDALAENAIKSKDPSLIFETKEILNVMAYKVLPNDMEHVLLHVATLNELLSNASTDEVLFNTSTQKEVANPIASGNKRFVLGDIDTEKIWKSPTQVTEAIRDINTFSNQTTDSHITNRDFEQATRILSVLDSIEQIYPMCEYIENCFNNLKKGEEEGINSNSYYESLITAVNTQLIQLWGMNFENLPVSMRAYINKFPERLDQALTGIRKRTSKEPYEQILKIINDIEKKKSVKNNYTREINMIHENLSSIQALFLHVTFEDYKLDLNKRLKVIDPILVRLENDRSAMYQKNAAERCRKALAYYKKIILFKNDDAKKAFQEFGLGKIDQRLLTPETNMCFNYVIQIIIEELPAEDAFQIQKEMVEEKKDRLEDL